MSFKKNVFLFMVIGALASFVSSGNAEQNETAVVPDTQNISAVGSDMQWIWGEIANIDPVANTITIKHLDYETDAEKETVISIDGKTVYEGIKSLGELKVKDSVSMDYVIEAGGMNSARTISVEKAQDVQDLEAGNMTEAVIPDEGVPLTTEAVEGLGY